MGNGVSEERMQWVIAAMKRIAEIELFGKAEIAKINETEITPFVELMTAEQAIRIMEILIENRRTIEVEQRKRVK